MANQIANLEELKKYVQVPVNVCIDEYAQKRVDEVVSLISKADKYKTSFVETMTYLRGYCDGKCTFTLFYDFAFASFSITCKKGSEMFWNGGLIFHGSHDGFGSGSAPTYSVCLNPADGWRIHT